VAQTSQQQHQYSSTVVAAEKQSSDESNDDLCRVSKAETPKKSELKSQPPMQLSSELPAPLIEFQPETISSIDFTTNVNLKDLCNVPEHHLDKELLIVIKS